MWTFGLTRLSLSFGGSWGSVAEGLGEGGGLPLGFSTTGVGFSFFSSTGGVGGEAGFSDGFSSEGATCVTPSPDFDIIATLVPGSTVSPSLATNYEHAHKNQGNINSKVTIR